MWPIGLVACVILRGLSVLISSSELQYEPPSTHHPGCPPSSGYSKFSLREAIFCRQAHKCVASHCQTVWLNRCLLLAAWVCRDLPVCLKYYTNLSYIYFPQGESIEILKFSNDGKLLAIVDRYTFSVYSFIYVYVYLLCIPKQHHTHILWHV